MAGEKKILSEKVKQTVKNKLVLHEVLRDSDDKLMLSIWRDELIELTKKTVEELTWLDFRYYLHKKKLTSFESATRVRRKLQEDHPLLRGKTYKQRQEKEKEVRQEIRESNQ